MLCRESCLQPDTRNSFGFWRNVFWRSTCIEWTASSYHWKFNKSCRHVAGPCLWSQENVPADRMTWSETLGILQVSFPLGILPLMQKELILRIAWLNSRGIKSQNCVSMNSLILRLFQMLENESQDRGMFLFNFSQATTRPDHLRPEIWPERSKAAQRKEKQQWTIEKPKLENARKMRGIYFDDPTDLEFKDTIQNARRKLDLQLEAAMLSKLKTFRYRETCGEFNNRVSKHARVVGAHESTRKRLEITLPKDHEAHVGGKVFSPLSHYNIVCPLLQRWKSRTQTPLWKKVGEAQKTASLAIVHRKRARRCTERAKNSAFYCADGHMSSQECGVGADISRIQSPGCAPRWLLWKTILALMQCAQTNLRLNLTSFSLFWRKFVASSGLVCLSCKNGETRAWT